MGNLGKIVAVSLLSGSAAVSHNDVEGYLYSRAGVAIMQPDGESPKPAPSGKCETCNGTGRVGDGRVSVQCQDCGGDGIVSTGSPNSFVAVQDVVCEDGVCRVVSSDVQGNEVSSVAALGDGCGILSGNGPVRRIVAKKPVRSLLGRIFRR